jgi:hypothetical protein
MNSFFMFVCSTKTPLILLTTSMIMAEKKKKEKDLCWKNYEQVGMKTKNGKKVPNCVPEKSKSGKK